jgi:hypothetical protein
MLASVRCSNVEVAISMVMMFLDATEILIPPPEAQ